MSGPPADPAPNSELPPRRAPVVPRAHRPGGSASLPLETLLTPLLKPNLRGLVAITAPPGGGKTTALQHLKAVLPSDIPVILFDSHQINAARSVAQSKLCILAAEGVDPNWKVLARFDLAPWRMDDCLEYLAASHRDVCPSVLKRLAADSRLDLLAGSPQMLILVMDEFARDPFAAKSTEILGSRLRELIPPSAARDQLMRHWSYRFSPEVAGSASVQRNATSLLSPAQEVWWRHDVAQRILAADWFADQICQGYMPETLGRAECRGLLPDIAAALRPRSAAADVLNRLILHDPQNASTPTAATMLLLINPQWRPPRADKINLCGAQLQNAEWSGIDLQCANLTNADLTGSDLRTAKLGSANLIAANLCAADLSGADCERTYFVEAKLTRANLTGANLNRATFHAADLSNACLRNATLSGAAINRANLAGADFSDANLNGAQLGQLRMNHATWNGATFRSATIFQCNLEGLDLPNADFSHANLQGSLLTASHIRGGNFESARLRRAGLSEIDWEGANLLGADFTDASFHLGSSRSGLVGSIIPSEGSKTGFYTDEFSEQDFKSPEEIRKANLCGADLRGANVQGTDFYLVDLRRAHYTEDQAAWFTRCGAILQSRVSG